MKKIILTLLILFPFALVAQTETDPVVIDTAAINKIAKEKIDTIYAKLMRGEDFAKLANLYSEDPGSNKTGGGYTDFIEASNLLPEFWNNTRNLKKGETSKPFKTQYGWHVSQLIEVHGTEVKFRHIMISTQNQ